MPEEQADAIAARTDIGFANDHLATKEFVRAEIAKLGRGLSRRLAGMLLLQAALVATPTKLL